jgi:SET domain-containing protein
MNKTNPIFECNSECQCSLETCQNRVSQKDDQSNNVQIISTSDKGYGVILQKSILHSGTYIGEYIGEVLSETEAHHRIVSTKNAEHNYLLLYNEHHSQTIVKTFIDARYYGNWTRFINHSCDPNLHIVPIRIDQSTPPHLAFFTLREIQANEELSYSYGTVIDEKFSKVCHCSSSACTGFMPYQQTD